MVATRNGGIATCDIPVSDNLEQFDRDYRTLTGQVRESGESYELGEDYMVIGTSALAGYEIDGAVNIYAGCYNNPFLIWGKYRKKWLRATLPVSFQFHHTQLDGIGAVAGDRSRGVRGTLHRSDGQQRRNHAAGRGTLKTGQENECCPGGNHVGAVLPSGDL